jgi:hypothetical protein
MLTMQVYLAFALDVDAKQRQARKTHGSCSITALGFRCGNSSEPSERLNCWKRGEILSLKFSMPILQLFSRFFLTFKKRAPPWASRAHRVTLSVVIFKPGLSLGLIGKEQFSQRLSITLPLILIVVLVLPFQFPDAFP